MFLTNSNYKINLEFFVKNNLLKNIYVTQSQKRDDLLFNINSLHNKRLNENETSVNS